MAVVTLKQVRQGEEVPRFSGVAWYCPERRVAVVLPVPINVIARQVRAAWHWLKFGYYRPDAIDGIAQDAYYAGRRSMVFLNNYHLNKRWQAGRDDGYKAGIRQTLIVLDAEKLGWKVEYIAEAKP